MAAALLALAAIAMVTADASAVYHPGMGRFLQRDPGPGPNSPTRAGAGGPAVGGRFIPPDPTGSNQYADGMNLYRYVSSNPITRADAWGLKDYRIGADDPHVGHDPGAGPHGSEEWRIKEWYLRRTILNSLYLVEGLLPNAVAHLRHYFGGSGSTYTINLVGMVNDVPSAKQLYKTELAEAMAFVEGLDPGDYAITSGAASGGYAMQSESKDWFYAVGGYSAWGWGIVNVSCPEGTRKYRLTFVYNVRDRYNWDTGKSVTIGPVTVTDAFMGTFHRQGFAQEFDMVGITTETIEWTEGEKHDIQPNPVGGGAPGRGGR